MDAGTTYFFDFVAKTNAELFPLFLAGCWISSGLTASLVTLIAAFALTRQGRAEKALVVLAAFVTGGLVVELLRLAVPRPLPSFAFKWLDVESVARGDLRQFYSTFPSGSIFLSVMAWLFLAFSMPRRRLALLTLAAAALVVFGGFICNLILARHYLTDLLAGMTGGAGLALVAWSFNPCLTQACMSGGVK
ncbi:MAG: phosphatase PAP2 family protein [Gemmataceae bacterium]